MSLLLGICVSLKCSITINNSLFFPLNKPFVIFRLNCSLRTIFNMKTLELPYIENIISLRI